MPLPAWLLRCWQAIRIARPTPCVTDSPGPDECAFVTYVRMCVCCESSPPDLSLSDTTELYVRARDSTLSRVHHLAQSRRPLVGSITVCFTTAKRAIIFISIQHDGQAENSYARKKKLTKPYPPTSSPSPTLDQQIKSV